MTEQYTIRPETFNKLRIQLLVKKILRLILILIAIYAIGYLNLTSSKPLSDLSLSVVQIIPFFVFFILIVSVIDITFTLFRHEKVLKSFKLTITEDELRREMDGLPTVRMGLEKIRLITKDKQRNLIVRGATSPGLVSIPREVNNYEHLENSLGKLMNIESENEFLPYPIQKILISALFFAGLVIVFSPFDKWVAVFTGLILSLYLLWKFIDIQKDKNTANAVRLKSYLMIPALLLIIFAILSNLVS